jgi:D-lactate dehydrogenase (cytochrome)
MANNILQPLNRDYEDYLRDESRRIGTAETISFPTNEAEVIEAILQIRVIGGNITVQGSRTGIVGGAVPQGGHILNLSRMKSIGQIIREEQSGELRVNVEPGVLLSELRDFAAREGLFFPPDPTETSASLGGMVACNASGALSFHYGPTRNWVTSLRVVLSDGSTIDLRRGENQACGRAFSLRTEQGRIICGTLPSYTLPNVKSAAGYYVADNMDLVDLFIGSEGTLGVITKIELRLIPKPAAVAGLTIFLPDEESALKLVRYLRSQSTNYGDPISLRPVAIEFFNSDALNLLRRMKTESSAFADIPTLRPHFHTALYTEFHGDSDEVIECAVMQVMEFAMNMGASDDDTWFATNERELEPLKAFRHATPEAVNLLIDERKRECPGLTKLGTDMSVPDEYLESTLRMYNAELREAGLESVIFGHIGNNHLHVNILPHTLEEYDRGRELYLSWARRVVEVGGSVSAEHGIGKIKAPFLVMMYGDEAVGEMRDLRRIFDPEGILNPGNLF